MLQSCGTSTVRQLESSNDGFIAVAYAPVGAVMSVGLTRANFQPMSKSRSRVSARAIEAIMASISTADTTTCAAIRAGLRDIKELSSVRWRRLTDAYRATYTHVARRFQLP